MVGDSILSRSRVEIDERARAARVALERCASTYHGMPVTTVSDARLGPSGLAFAVAALWRRLAGPAAPTLTPLHEGPPPALREPFV